MRRTGFDETRDQQVAAEVADDRWLRCAANDCPCKWTVSVGGARGLCSSHAWAELNLWPIITRQMLDDELDRARGARVVPAPKLADRETAMQRLRELRLGSAAPRQWAEDLERREREGKRLTPFQREAWREVRKGWE